MASIDSSRICVKGLPKHATEQRVRDFFSFKGDVTDVKLLRTKAGKFRHMAFIGFREPSQAQAAVKHFDKAFMDASKLQVELARAPGAADLPRPWSRHTAGSSAHSKTKGGSEPEYTVTHHSQPASAGQPSTLQSLAEARGLSMDDPKLQEFIAVAQGKDVQPAAKTAGARDDAGSGSGSDSDEEGAAASASAAAPEPAMHSVEDSGRIFVRNLPYSASEEEIDAHFRAVGPLAEVSLPRDSAGRLKGFGVITYMVPEHAVKAMQDLDGQFFQGRLLHVLPAKPQADSAKAQEGGSSEPGSSSFKRQQEEAKRAAAASGEEMSVWNALFMRADAAVAVAAARAGTSAGEVMDRDADNLAVRAALGETAIIEETKTWLADEGVDLAALTQALKGEAISRSTTTIIVKNLPTTTDDVGLRALFSKHGKIARWVMPPAKVLALVEFAEPASAKAAFTGLAYTRYQRAPLFLEWAPADLLRAASSATKPSKAAEEASAPSAETPPNLPAAAGAALFVKNVNFSTTEDGLRAMFDRVAPTRSVHIPKRTHKKDGATVQQSMGYAFVEFQSADAAEQALKELQGATCDGHALELRRSKRGDEKSSAGVKRKRAVGGAANTKITVKNVAFEATKSDLRQLFGAFGHLKSVRLPKKPDGSNRGFAFVEYAALADAKRAMESLAATHLYGRHLVLEYSAEVDLDDAIVKTGADAAQTLGVGTVDASVGVNLSSKGTKKRRGTGAV